MDKLSFSEKRSLKQNGAVEATETFLRLIKRNEVILDIGSGFGKHSKIFKVRNLKVETIDLDPKKSSTYTGDFLAYEFNRKFDALWCNHTLEHQLNVNLFLKKMLDIVKENGLVAITVPRAYFKNPPNRVVSGHVTMWNTGLLLYNMILAGFDCSEALARTSGYNSSVIVRAKKIEKMPELTMNRGDIEKLEPYFPFEAEQGFDGDIENIGFPV